MVGELGKKISIVFLNLKFLSTCDETFEEIMFTGENSSYSIRKFRHVFASFFFNQYADFGLNCFPLIIFSPFKYILLSFVGEAMLVEVVDRVIE